MRKFLIVCTILWIAILTLWASCSHAQNVGYTIAADGVKFPQKNWANLPDPTQSSGVIYQVPDAPGGISLAVSDGTAWKLFGRGYSSQVYTLATADNGVHTFTYAMTATPTVIVGLTDNTTTGTLTFNTYNVTSTSATVRVNRGLLAALTGGVTAGVTINLFVIPAN